MIRADIAGELKVDTLFRKHNEKTQQALIGAALEDELLWRTGAIDEQKLLASQ